MHRHRAGLPPLRGRRDVHDQPTARSRGGVARARGRGSRVAPRRGRRRRSGRPRGGARRRRGGALRRPLRAGATWSADSCGRQPPGRPARSCSTSSSTSSVSSIASVSTCRLGAAATPADVRRRRSPTSSSARPGRCRGRRRSPSPATRAWSPSWDLLGGRGGEIPKRALVVDDGSGFWQGISAAEYLAERGAGVELVTPARAVGLAIPEESVANVHRRPALERRPLPRPVAGHRCRRHDGAACRR